MSLIRFSSFSSCTFPLRFLVIIILLSGLYSGVAIVTGLLSPFYYQIIIVGILKGKLIFVYLF